MQPEGIIVGTLHAFWHARYWYERARQIGLLVREMRSFRSSSQPAFRLWPTFLAGDFNIQPSEAAYRFLTDTPLSAFQQTALLESRIVHASVDKLNGTHRGDDAYITMQGDEDRVFTNVRTATEDDNLLTEDELRKLYRPGPRLTSVYGRWGNAMEGQEGNFFKDRPTKDGQAKAIDGSDEEARIRQGAYEPMWSGCFLSQPSAVFADIALRRTANFTPLWRCTLGRSSFTEQEMAAQLTNCIQTTSSTYPRMSVPTLPSSMSQRFCPRIEATSSSQVCQDSA